mmetsp:Transcript_177/g.367  ORF Transcript_177/g.367 Transcript_177/m.367 type:complete len:224 (+) Transcript_177:157-828(+)
MPLRSETSRGQRLWSSQAVMESRSQSFSAGPTMGSDVGSLFSDASSMVDLLLLSPSSPFSSSIVMLILFPTVSSPSPSTDKLSPLSYVSPSLSSTAVAILSPSSVFSSLIVMATLASSFSPSLSSTKSILPSSSSPTTTSLPPCICSPFIAFNRRDVALSTIDSFVFTYLSSIVFINVHITTISPFLAVSVINGHNIATISILLSVIHDHTIAFYLLPHLPPP